MVDQFRRFASFVEPSVVIDVVDDDPDDNRILECAVTADAEVIVSGDKHLLALGDFHGIRILSPADFLALLGTLARPD